jgi:O-acetyl-ADP-ribose deacetylase (regulator of RNase III)
MEFRMIQGGIAQESAEALVTAAGTSLWMGSGVGGAPSRGGERSAGRRLRPMDENHRSEFERPIDANS